MVVRALRKRKVQSSILCVGTPFALSTGSRKLWRPLQATQVPPARGRPAVRCCGARARAHTLLRTRAHAAPGGLCRVQEGRALAATPRTLPARGRPPGAAPWPRAASAAQQAAQGAAHRRTTECVCRARATAVGRGCCAPCCRGAGPSGASCFADPPFPLMAAPRTAQAGARRWPPSTATQHRHARTRTQRGLRHAAGRCRHRRRGWPCGGMAHTRRVRRCRAHRKAARGGQPCRGCLRAQRGQARMDACEAGRLALLAHLVGDLQCAAALTLQLLRECPRPRVAVGTASKRGGENTSQHAAHMSIAVRARAVPRSLLHGRGLVCL